MSGNLYYRTEEGGEVICLTPKDQRRMGRRGGKTELGFKIVLAVMMHGGVNSPENCPVVEVRLMKLNIETGESVEVVA